MFALLLIFFLPFPSPAVQSCDDRLTRLETSQNHLMDNLTTLEEQLSNVKHHHATHHKNLPLLKARTAQLDNIRKRMNTLHATMNTMVQRVKHTEQKLSSLPKHPVPHPSPEERKVEEEEQQQQQKQQQPPPPNVEEKKVEDAMKQRMKFALAPNTNELAPDDGSLGHDDV